MPTKFTIPESRVTNCEPCEFHKLIGALHVRCGEGSYREYACKHPDAHGQMPANADPEVVKIIAQLESLSEGRYIGKTERQPDWCPLRPKAN